MEIKNRLFPYPVLGEENDDYREGRFYVEGKISREDANYFYFEFKFVLEDKELLNLINRDKAEYVFHVECATTCYRTVMRTASNEIEYKIKKNDVNGKVTIVAMVVATKNIPYYNNIALDRDYDNIDVSFRKGSILAYYNLPVLNINSTYNVLATKESIFSVSKQDRQSSKDRNEVKYSINSNKIKIYLDDDVYQKFVLLKDNMDYKYLINSVILMPALIFALDELRDCKDEDDLEHYKQYDWYIQLNQYFKNSGREESSFEDIINNNENIIKIAQDILDNPICNLLLNINKEGFE